MGRTAPSPIGIGFDRSRRSEASLRRARHTRTSPRRFPLSRIQIQLRKDHRLRLRIHIGTKGRNHRQQRRTLLGIVPQGRTLRRTVQSARRAPPLSSEHYRFHDRTKIRTRRHRQGRREVGDGRGVLERSQAHADRGGVVRGGELRNVRTELRPAIFVHVAQRAHRGHGGRAGGGGTGRGSTRRRRIEGRDVVRRGGGRIPKAHSR
mmetsp:Transcript_22066/g.65363  ORF Transcript_22066/g.65363 Transcript_22066/m.65363 type:complete len:206 (+) Transcript_22066:1602-2219(+)